MEEEKKPLREIDKDKNRKKKILMIGNNEALKDDFFTQMTSVYDMLSTSFRSRDIGRHLEIFEPDVLAVCLNDEEYDDIAKIYAQKKKLEGVRVVVIGLQEEVERFDKTSDGMVDLKIFRPIKIEMIKVHIEHFFDELRKQELKEQKDNEESEKEAEKERMKEDIQNMWHAVEQSDQIMDSQMMERMIMEKMNARRRRIILVIDDDTLMLKVIKEHLKADYDVATAISGKVAYKFIEKKKPDMILLDYKMPGEDGPEVLRYLREELGLVNMPVVFLTGVSDANAIKKVLALKPQGYLLKPVDRVKLLETVKKFSGA